MRRSRLLYSARSSRELSRRRRSVDLFHDLPATHSNIDTSFCSLADDEDDEDDETDYIIALALVLCHFSR